MFILVDPLSTSLQATHLELILITHFLILPCGFLILPCGGTTCVSALKGVPYIRLRRCCRLRVPYKFLETLWTDQKPARHEIERSTELHKL